MLNAVQENSDEILDDETLELEGNKNIYDSESAEKFWEAMNFISAQNQFFVSRMNRIL